jgi:glucosylceramidase
VSWIAYQDQWSGVARVYVDGELKTTIDTFASPARTGVAAYSITGLAPGTHTIAIEATGTRNGSAQGSWVWVDAFDVVP